MDQDEPGRRGVGAGLPPRVGDHDGCEARSQGKANWNLSKEVDEESKEGRELFRLNLDTRRQCHQIRRGLTSAVPTLRSSAGLEYSNQRSNEGVDDVVAKQRERQRMNPTKLTENPKVDVKETPRLNLGMATLAKHGRISGRPALRNSVQTEHRSWGLDGRDQKVSRLNLDTGRLGEPGRISGRSVPRSSVNAEDRFLSSDKDGWRTPVEMGNDSELSRLYVDTGSGDVAPRTHLGERRRDVHKPTSVLRVNIRARGGEVEVNEEEPKFGSGRAAPPQGADCGRPSKSANEGDANGANGSESDGRPNARGHGSATTRLHRRLPEIPYSATSSEERYQAPDGGRRPRARVAHKHKTSKLVPEVGYSLSWSRASSSDDASDEHRLELGNERSYHEVDPVDQDPWNKAMYSVLTQPQQRRGVEREQADRERDLARGSISDILTFSMKNFVGQGNDCGTTVRQCERHRGSGAVVDPYRRMSSGKIWVNSQVDSINYTEAGPEKRARRRKCQENGHRTIVRDVGQ